MSTSPWQGSDGAQWRRSTLLLSWCSFCCKPGEELRWSSNLCIAPSRPYFFTWKGIRPDRQGTSQVRGSPSDVEVPVLEFLYVSNLTAGRFRSREFAFSQHHRLILGCTHVHFGLTLAVTLGLSVLKLAVTFGLSGLTQLSISKTLRINQSAECTTKSSSLLCRQRSSASLGFCSIDEFWTCPVFQLLLS